MKPNANKPGHEHRHVSRKSALTGKSLRAKHKPKRQTGEGLSPVSQQRLTRCPLTCPLIVPTNSFDNPYQIRPKLAGTIGGHICRAQQQRAHRDELAGTLDGHIGGRICGQHLRVSDCLPPATEPWSEEMTQAITDG